MKRIFPLLLLTLTLFACNSSQTVENEGKTENTKPLIVCTTGMITDAVKNIVGDSAEVIGLMGPGVDPHLYKASQGDLEYLSSADIIIYNGLHLEGKMGEVFEKLSRKKRIIVAAEAMRKEQFIGDSEGNYDPHLWFDVATWARVCQYLGTTLSKEKAFNTEIVIQNTNKYLSQLKELHRLVGSEISSIDSDKRVLITAHDAFGYFGKAYDIEVKGLQGISTLSEYGLKDVSDMVDFIVDRKIKAVFIESSVSDAALEAVVEGCSEKGHEIRIGGILYSDAMGTAGTEEGTYIGMVKYNVSTIVDALK